MRISPLDLVIRFADSHSSECGVTLSRFGISWGPKGRAGSASTRRILGLQAAFYPSISLPLSLPPSLPPSLSLSLSLHPSIHSSIHPSIYLSVRAYERTCTRM